ncbi:MAG: DUF1211 domain-containing protein [Proteobacteria bacterium]|nr:DUF1211 domain-containing protein [Pseudomonadota bacterium]
MSDDLNEKLNLNRILALSDGVFSIVITLLIFEVRLPSSVDTNIRIGDMELVQNIIQITPKLFSYIATFILIGIYWTGHHGIFKHIVKHNRGLIWLNNFFLMCVCFMPFPTYILGNYYYLQTAVILYGSCLILTGSSLYLLWSYATTNRRLVESKLPDSIITIGKQRIMMAPLVGLFSILISFYSPQLSLWFYVAGLILYLMPSRIDKAEIPIS